MHHWVGKANIGASLPLTQHEIPSWNLIIYILLIIQMIVVYNSKSCNSSRHTLQNVVLMIGHKIEIGVGCKESLRENISE